MNPLAVPLTLAQIDAGCRLHDQLDQWQGADRALRALRQRFPEFSADATLLKAVVINSLYGTNVYAIVIVAEHCARCIEDSDLERVGPEFVEQLAKAPGGRRFVSFASKFAHFFVDETRFPIKDTVAEKVVERHLGRKNCRRDGAHPYLSFVENLGKLRQSIKLSGPNRELDPYLWIAGQYAKWKARGQTAKINRESARLFESPSARAAADLRILAGG